MKPAARLLAGTDAVVAAIGTGTVRSVAVVGGGAAGLELVLALSTTVAVLVVDILYGILVAIALSILDLLRRVARPHDGVLGYAPGVDFTDGRAGTVGWWLTTTG